LRGPSISSPRSCHLSKTNGNGAGGRFSITVCLRPAMFRICHLMRGMADCAAADRTISPGGGSSSGTSRKKQELRRDRRVEIVTLAVDTLFQNRHPPNPLMVIVAAIDDRRLIFAHLAASGFQVRVAASSGVSSMPSPAFGSISPLCKRSPAVSIRIPSIGLEADLNHPPLAASAGSCQKEMWEADLGGKTDPSGDNRSQSK